MERVRFEKNTRIKYKSDPTKNDAIFGKHITTIKPAYMKLVSYSALLFISSIYVMIEFIQGTHFYLYNVVNITWLMPIFSIVCIGGTFFAIVKVSKAPVLEVFEYGISFNHLNGSYEEIKITISNNVIYEFQQDDESLLYNSFLSKNNKKILNQLVEVSSKAYKNNGNMFKI